MSQEQIDALVARYNDDSVFAAAMDAVAGTDDAVRVAAEHGFEVDAAELASSISTLDLTDAELEGVAGGYSCSPMCMPANS